GCAQITGPTSRVRSNTTMPTLSRASDSARPGGSSVRNSMKGVSHARNLPHLNREPLTNPEGEAPVTANFYERMPVGARHLLHAIAWSSVPGIVLAQASPFMTGMTSLQANILSWLTPVAIILVMVLG